MEFGFYCFARLQPYSRCLTSSISSTFYFHVYLLTILMLLYDSLNLIGLISGFSSDTWVSFLHLTSIFQSFMHICYMQTLRTPDLQASPFVSLIDVALIRTQRHFFVTARRPCHPSSCSRLFASLAFIIV